MLPAQIIVRPLNNSGGGAGGSRIIFTQVTNNNNVTVPQTILLKSPTKITSAPQQVSALAVIHDKNQ